MRQRFKQQTTLGITPINEVKFPLGVDNVSLIDEELLFEINKLVVEHGHNLLKKRRTNKP